MKKRTEPQKQVIPTHEEVTKIQHALTQANIMKWMGVICIIIPVIAIIIFATTLITNPIIAILSIAIIYGLSTLIISIVMIVKIAGNNWLDDELNKAKTVYWVISLVFTIIDIPFVAPITWIIWGSKVKKTLSKKLQ